MYAYLKDRYSRYRRYLSNLSASFISQAVSAISILLLTPVLLRSLGEDSFGVYGTLLNVITLAAVFDLGLNVGLLRKLIHSKEQSTPIISTIFFFFIFLLLISIPVFYLMFRFELLGNGDQYLITSVFTSLIVGQNIIALFFDVMIQSANKIFLGKMIRIIKTVIEFGLLYWVCNYGSIVSIFMAIGFVNFIYLFILAHYAKKEVPFQLSFSSFNFTLLRSHIVYSFWYFQTTVSSVLVYNAQIILISSMVAPAAVSKYYIVMRFFEVIRTGMGNFTMILFPSLSLLQVKANWVQLKRMFMRVSVRVCLMVVVAMVIVLTIGEQFFSYWSKYYDVETIQLYRWYAILIAFLLIEHVPVVFLSALKFNKLPAILGTIQGVIGLLLTYLLVPYYGIAGAVMSSLIALLCTNFIFNPVYLFKRISTEERSMTVAQ